VSSTAHHTSNCLQPATEPFLSLLLT